MKNKRTTHTYLVAFIDKDDNKVTKHVKTKSRRKNKVIKQIETLFKIKVSECKEFQFTEVYYDVRDTNIQN